MKRLLILFALCLAPSLTRAEQIHPLEIKYDVCGFYSVLHINGVDTSLLGAQDNRNALATAYGNAHKGWRVRYGLAYNETSGLIMDVHQAYQQIAFGFPGITYGDWLGHVLYAILPRWITDSILGDIGGKLKGLLAWRRTDTTFNNELSRLVAQANSLGFLNSGSRMTIVGHSHGTIYANIMYRYLMSGVDTFVYRMQPQQVGLMSIAAFVPIIEGNGLFVTNRNDNPVNAGRALYSDVKAGTVTIPHTEPSTYVWRGHNLINKYLADAGSKAQIKANMKTIMDRLQRGRPTTPAPPPTWAMYPFSDVSYRYCVPTPTQPCRWVINGEPQPGTDLGGSFYWWYIPNGSYYTTPIQSDDARAGTTGNAQSQAIVNGKVCYSAMIAKVLPMKKAGINNWPTVQGCWGPTNQLTYWWVYSGDGPPVYKSTYDPYYQKAYSYAAPTCKPVI